LTYAGFSLFCLHFDTEKNYWIARTAPGNDGLLTQSERKSKTNGEHGSNTPFVITRFIRVIQIFLTMVKYHSVGAVMTVGAECPGLSTVVSYLFLQPVRAAYQSSLLLCRRL
jgi:hypothetical protein